MGINYQLLGVVIAGIGVICTIAYYFRYFQGAEIKITLGEPVFTLNGIILRGEIVNKGAQAGMIMPIFNENNLRVEANPPILGMSQKINIGIDEAFPITIEKKGLIGIKIDIDFSEIDEVKEHIDSSGGINFKIEYKKSTKEGIKRDCLNYYIKKENTPAYFWS